jgi:hypothetical protein
MSKGELLETREVIKKTYNWTKGSWDIYIAFFELGFKIMNGLGVLAFITPDKWLSKPFGKTFRAQTLGYISSLLKAGREIFEDANVDSIVSLFTKKGRSKIDVLLYEDKDFQLMREISKETLASPFTFDHLFSQSLDFIAKLSKASTKLGDIATCENACATDDAYKLKPLVQDSTTKFTGDYLKVINTGTISKYRDKWGKQKMTYLGDKYIKPVVEKQRFLNLFGGRSYGRRSIQKKLLIKGLNLLDACLDEKGNVIPGIPTLVVVSNDVAKLKLLLALINSKLSFFFIKERYPSSSYNQGINFTPDMINDLPVPTVSTAYKNKAIALVNKILAITKDDDYLENPAKQARVREYEKQIDQLVYKLYGLTDEEIKIVESAQS